MFILRDAIPLSVHSVCIKCRYLLSSFSGQSDCTLYHRSFRLFLTDDTTIVSSLSIPLYLPQILCKRHPPPKKIVTPVSCCCYQSSSAPEFTLLLQIPSIQCLICSLKSSENFVAYLPVGFFAYIEYADTSFVPPRMSVTVIVYRNLFSFASIFKVICTLPSVIFPASYTYIPLHTIVPVSGLSS